MIFEFNGYRPVIHQSSFVHPQANVTGNVIIGTDCYIGPGAVLRGDWGEILVADGCNIQENCVVHMFPGKSAVFEAGAHIGHGAIIHGAKVGKNVLVGMNAVLMDDVEVGENSIVGALCFVPANMIIPPKSLVVGNPAKIIKEVSDEMISWKTEGTKLYQQLPTDCYKSLRECEPLREKEANRPAAQQYFFKTWADKKED
jgi:carbonic anhydrase/acetyltransferase-like protein (isoleucine patch superfamily)